jgi:putative ABC transport system permease protein
VLSVATLAVGGAAFIAALDVAEGWNDSVRRDFSRRRYDLSVQFTEPQLIGTLERILDGVPEVASTEYWAGGSPYLIGAAGVPTVSVSLVGPEASSKLLALPLMSGRWLEAGDSSAAVLNQAVVAREPALRVGGQLRLRVGDRDVSFPIVGIVKELAPMPVVYAPRPAVLAATGRDGSLARTVRVVSRSRDEAGELAAARAVEDAFEREGLEIAGVQRMTDTKKGILDHLVIIQSILIMASIIVVLVGAIALTSTLTLSVIQRTRELGIMGALGATPRVLAGQVWFEGMAIGLLSWLVANVLAMPLAWLLESTTGQIFFKAPLDFHIGLTPSLLWLGLTLVLATISSAQPAWRAARLTVREALGYA